jgi:hypothetical protein
MGGEEEDEGFALATDASGNTYVTGFCVGDSRFGETVLPCEGPTDAFLAKLDSEGNIDWAVQGGGPGIDKGYGVAVYDNSVYLVGTFEGSATFGDTPLSSQGDSDAFVAKYSLEGQLLWIRSIGSNGSETANAVVADAMGVYVTGYMQETISVDGHSITAEGATDVFVARVASDSWVEWLTRGGGQESDYGMALAHNPGGGVYLGGMFQGEATFGNTALSADSIGNIVVASLDEDGEYRWAKSVGGEGRDMVTGLATDGDGVLATGHFEDTVSFGDETKSAVSSEDIYLSRISEEGTFLWTETAGGVNADFGQGVSVGPAGEITVTGYIGGRARFADDSHTPVGSDDCFAWRVKRPRSNTP